MMSNATPGVINLRPTAPGPIPGQQIAANQSAVSQPQPGMITRIPNQQQIASVTIVQSQTQQPVSASSATSTPTLIGCQPGGLDVVSNAGASTMANTNTGVLSAPQSAGAVGGIEKSPMCLVNELARHNGVTHQYHLVSETGPPHDKRFTVSLTLGNEEYCSTGQSIRKAQHGAAGLALKQTQLKHPPPKSNRNNRSNWPLTPTVELNVLAMRRGEPTNYKVFEIPPPLPKPAYESGPCDYRSMHYQRYNIHDVPRGYYTAKLDVGPRQFTGKGRTAQIARHNAAEEALKALRDLPLPEHRVKTQTEGVEVSPQNASVEVSTSKSPISLIYEMSMKLNLMVKFEVTSETGPSHMPTFITKCVVGEFITVGEGNGKKISKQRAAEKMYVELQKLPIPQCENYGRPRKHFYNNPRKFQRRKSNNLIKSDQKENQEKLASGENAQNEVKGAEVETTSEVSAISKKSPSSLPAPIHPINRLIQLQQARKEREPIFRIVDEKQMDRRKREFVIECAIKPTKPMSTVSGVCSAGEEVTATGKGNNKKTAKKNAAEAMLRLIGFSKAPSLEACSDNIDTMDEQQKVRKVKFIENKSQQGTSPQNKSTQNENKGKPGRQLRPGLLLMPSSDSSVTNDASQSSNGKENSDGTHVTNGNSNEERNGTCNDSVSLAAIIAKELLETGTSPTAARKENSEPQKIIRHSAQIQYLANVLKSTQLQVHFSDFPKKQNNTIEVLTVVTLTWPQGNHYVATGTSTNSEQSRDEASLHALQTLSKLAVPENCAEEQIVGDVKN